MKKITLLIVLILGFLINTKAQKFALKEHFKTENTPLAPDYSNPNHWAALPEKQDFADKLPEKQNYLKDNQANAEADVFFIHPTIFTYQPKGKNLWNGDLNDAELNKKVDESTILYQASIFNAAGKIYAPRYRQAHLYSYFTPDLQDGNQAFEIAYGDVKAAFEYYLKYYNHGRPIIIACHSQGTTHGKRLLKEFFDGKPLQKQLVMAYLIGIPTPANYFETIPPATFAGQTGCFATWCTYRKNYFPPNYEKGLNKSLSVNPLTWDTTFVHVKRKQNKGSVLLKYKLTKPGFIDAENHDGMLWVGNPHIFGGRLIKIKNWHRADYNLFWINVRENAVLRVNSFLKKK